MSEQIIRDKQAVSEKTQTLLEKTKDLSLKGRVPAGIFNNEEIYQLERERIFSRCWIFLAHETEIPEPGDYVVREIADNSIIVVRDEKGQIRAHLNVCRHRGTTVCHAEMGNASHFRCPYHGWTYQNSGKLIGVTAIKKAFPKDFNKEEFNLASIRVDSYEGLIFGNLDPEAESLDEYLGGFQWYMDYILKTSLAGAEVAGPPEKFVIDIDWKVGSENFAGDGYHTPIAHQFAFDMGYFPTSTRTHSGGISVHIPNKGHGIGFGVTPGMDFTGYQEGFTDQVSQLFDPDQAEIFRETRTALGTIFPNCSILSTAFSLKPGGEPTRFWSVRLWHPIGPGKIQFINLVLVPKDSSDEYKKRSIQAFRTSFGVSGTFEQDDMEIWRNLTRGLKGTVAQDLLFPYEMGIDGEPLKDFPGPGVAKEPYFNETNFRNQWHTWANYMLKE
ncbi:aromatic ring-hydroxylating oxygenase subunit alpha [Bacillus sp. Marseille-P3661]|uniref:aromatic ring-hydroxylating oxygenase subunit alpha n=1 Tax=Bacillus sp. Marseille-P3661 TaxID=1936234 RepID=UPI000C83B941|nr:aromatic ring-hydroxylating dioxygenase subunit alpha [Bacillus sp. Marseille-P3661]